MRMVVRGDIWRDQMYIVKPDTDDPASIEAI
jgi:hypothetical protein